MWDYANLDGDAGYIDNLFGQSPPEYSFDYRIWDKYNISGQQSKISEKSSDINSGAAHKTNRREIDGRQQMLQRIQR